MTVSNAADRSSGMITDDLEAALADWRALSVEWPVFKPDWLGSRRLFRERKFDSWLHTACSIVFLKKSNSDTGL